MSAISSIPPPVTTVDLLWIEQSTERWIRFGRESDERIIDRRQRIVSFRAGAIFAFVRWASNDYGTAVSRIDILRAADRTEAYSTVPFVDPGGEILLRVHGWPKVQRVFAVIDRVEMLGFDAADAAPDYWRHVHNRLTVGDAPRDYSLARHRTWLMRRELEA